MSRRLSEVEELLDRLTEELESGLGAELPLREVPVDVVDRGDAFLVTAELPGFTREQLTVELRGGRLRIAGEREADVEADEEDLTGRFVRRERRRESVTRTVPLPEEVDESAVTATYGQGILEVTLPKAADAGEGHQIEIE